MVSNAKTSKQSGSEKTASFFGSSGKDYMGSSSKSSNIISEKRYVPETSGKTSNVLATRSSTLGSSGKTSANESSKNSSMLGSTGKAANVLLSSGKEPKPFGSEKKNNSSPLSFSGKNAVVTDPSQAYPSFISPKVNKPSTKFGIIWIPTRKHNKRKDAVYSSHNYENYNSRAPTMYSYMSGDSPDYQPHKKKEEETLLVPERAKLASVAVNTGITAANIDIPPDSSGPANPEEKQEFIRRDTEDKDAAGDTNENDKSDKDYLENSDNVANKSPENKWDKEKQGDKVDSVYLRPPPAHKARSTTSTNEEEDCGIKCLYYTLQCCDCVLM